MVNNLSFTKTSKFICPLFIILLISVLTSSCDNNEKSRKTSFATIQQKKQVYRQETTLKGKVSNNKGVLRSGEINIADSKGKILAETTLQNSNHFSVKVPAGTELPIILTFHPTANSDDKDIMTSVIINTSIKTFNINELTTEIAKKAKALGGYTIAHMVSAAESTVSVPDAKKTTAGFSGDPTKQYGGWH